MEKFSQFRDRGRQLQLCLQNLQLTVPRLGHCALPPYSIRTTRAASTPPDLPLLLPLTPVPLCDIGLFPHSTMASYWITGQESRAVVHSWRSKYLVD